MRNQSVREGSHAGGTMWYVPNELHVCKYGGEGDNCANITQPMIGKDKDD